MITKRHHYFNLNYRSLPIILRLRSFNLIISMLIFFKFYSSTFFILNLIILTLGRINWWILFSEEINLKGKRSTSFEDGIKLSILLFISSEIFFFFSFFWRYFDFYLSPAIELGLNWPPEIVQAFECLNVPLVNTIILLTSGITVTISHAILISGDKKNSIKILALTVTLGVLFTLCQLLEYESSFFCIRDSNFGRAFFILTGFHGLHVIIGSIFLIISLIRHLNLNSNRREYLRFEIASWYWHFVDVVWIFLYFTLYYLNS